MQLKRWPLGSADIRSALRFQAQLRQASHALEMVPSARLLSAVFALSMAYFVVGIQDGPINVYDEGATLYGGEAVLRGEVPGRDFYTPYPPGQFYLTALAFSILGTSIYSERLLSLAFQALLVCGMFACTSLVARRWLALAAAAALLVWVDRGKSGFFGISAIWAFAVASFALYLGWRYSRLAYRWPLLGTGALVGLSTLIRYDVGAYTGLSLLGYQTLLALTQQRGSGRFVTALSARAGPTICGLLVVLAAFGVLFSQAARLDLLFSESAGLRLAELEGYIRPYPPLFPDLASLWKGPRTLLELPGYFDKVATQFPFYFPLVALAVTGVVLTLKLRRQHHLEAPDWLLLAALMAWPWFSIQAVVKPSANHLVAVGSLGFLMVAWLISAGELGRLLKATRLRTIPFVALLGACALASTLTIHALLIKPLAAKVTQVERILWVESDDRLKPLQLERAQNVYLHSDVVPGLVEAVSFVQANTRQGEPIFVGNERHDVTEVNDVLFYFVARRPSGTRYPLLDASVTTRADVQQDMIRELEHNQVRYAIVRRWGFPHLGVPDSQLLDDYLQRTFSPLALFDPYVILERRG